MKEWLDLAMFLALCVFVLLGYPVSFTLAGTALIFGLAGMALGIFDPDFLGVFPHRIYGVMTNEVLIAIPLFIFMGVMLERSKVAEELLDTMGQLFGRLRGGLGISVSVVGAMLAATCSAVNAGRLRNASTACATVASSSAMGGTASAACWITIARS